ncbi:MAG: InlB B-repeat-containing protein [Candidatus Gracilibacteria bacterium]|nr:InlB B-repeat-containing protein [Candidatus Gracilibacteria bacterium]
MNNQNKKGFTLVELIVTIVILAILGTIAFISFQGYSKNARDTQRIADINHVEKSLGLFVVNTGFYPNPDKSKDITYMGGTAWIEGTLGDTVLKNIDKVSKTPLDPLTGNEYTYSITPSRTEYQIGAISEVGGIALNSIFTDKIYAADLSKAVAYIKGNYNEKITRVHSGNTNLVLAMPSIVVTDITDPKLENILPKKILVFNNYGNIPHSYNPTGTLTGELEYNPTNLVVFSGATIDLTASNDKIDFVTNLQNAYSGTFVEDNVAYSELMSIDPVSDGNSAISLVNNYLTYNVGGITGTQTAIVYNDCILDGQAINHGQTITAYSENNILSGASYECSDRAIERTCNNGLLSGDDSYIYKTCVKGIPSNCEASGSYIYAGHTYNIPIINHGETATNLISSEVTETTGVYTYTLSSITCNDGSLINPIESGTTAVVTCNTGYITNGTTCVGSTYSVTLDANGGTAGTTIVTSTYNASMPTITVLPTRTGYTFNGYFSATSGGTKYYNSDGSSAISYLLTSGTTLYAQWTANTYTVTLSANGGTVGTTSVTSTYNASMPTIAVLPTRTGYTFNGYYTATSGGTKYYNSDGSSATSYLLTSGTTLYAQWTASTYTVTLDANGGTAGTSSVTSTYNASMPTIAVLPTRTGYTFNGYYSATSGGTKYYNSDGSSAISYLLTSGTTLYAQWTANTYTVSGSFGTTASGSTIVVCGSNVIADSNGSFSVTRNYGSVCNDILATLTGYSCTTTTNGPATLTSNVNNITGDCAVAPLLTSATCIGAGWIRVTSTKDVYIGSTTGNGFCISPRYGDWNNDSTLGNGAISWNGWGSYPNDRYYGWNASAIDDTGNPDGGLGQTKKLDSEVSYNCKPLGTASSDYVTEDSIFGRMKWLSTTGNSYTEARSIDWITGLVPATLGTYPQAIPAIYIADCIDGVKDLGTTMTYKHIDNTTEEITYAEYNTDVTISMTGAAPTNETYQNRQKYMIAWTQKTGSHLPSAMSNIANGYLAGTDADGNSLSNTDRGEYQTACQNSLLTDSNDYADLESIWLANLSGTNWGSQISLLGGQGCTWQLSTTAGNHAWSLSTRFIVRP